MKYEKIKDGIVNVLNSLGYDYKFFTPDGAHTSNPYESKYIFVNDPNIMFIIEDTSNVVEMHKSNVKLSTFKKVVRLIRSLTTKYFVSLEVQDYNQSIKPKDFSKDILRKRYNMEQKMAALDESVLPKTPKTFYESYDNVVFFHENDSIKMIDGKDIRVFHKEISDYIPAISEGVSAESIQQLINLKKDVDSVKSCGNLYGNLVDEKGIEHKVNDMLKRLK